MSVVVTFRRLQALSDLNALAARLYPRIRDRLGLTPEQRADMRAHADLGFGAQAGPLSRSLAGVVHDLAGDVDGQDDLFTFGNALEFAAALTSGIAEELLASRWDTVGNRIVTLPPVARAAFVQALRSARRVERDDGLDAFETSVDREVVSAQLCNIARGVTEAELTHISRADYWNDEEAHLAALKKVIFEQDCVFTEDQGWVPSEVVELVSHVPGETGFGVTTAILLNHCIHKGDMQGSTDFRWANNAETYLSMPPDLRAPVLAAFRYIYETDAGWEPYFTALFEPEDFSAVLLPPVNTDVTNGQTM